MVPTLSPPWSIIIALVVAVYAGAGIAALIQYRDWGIRRLLPILSVLLPAVTAMGAVEFGTERWAYRYVLSTLLAPLLVLITLQSAWRGPRLAERILRMSGLIVLGYFLYNLVVIGIP